MTERVQVGGLAVAASLHRFRSRGARTLDINGVIADSVAAAKR